MKQTICVLRDYLNLTGSTGHTARIGDMRNAYRIFIVKPERKKQFERPKHRPENNNNVCETEYYCVNTCYLICIAGNSNLL